MGQISSFRRDQFMIDTQSGRAWELVCMKVPETDANGCSLWGLRPLVYLDAVGTPVGVTPSAAPAGR